LDNTIGQQSNEVERTTTTSNGNDLEATAASASSQPIEQATESSNEPVTELLDTSDKKAEANTVVSEPAIFTTTTGTSRPDIVSITTGNPQLDAVDGNVLSDKGPETDLSAQSATEKTGLLLSGPAQQENQALELGEKDGGSAPPDVSAEHISSIVSGATNPTNERLELLQVPSGSLQNAPPPQLIDGAEFVEPGVTVNVGAAPEVESDRSLTTTFSLFDPRLQHEDLTLVGAASVSRENQAQTHHTVAGGGGLDENPQDLIFLLPTNGFGDDSDPSGHFELPLHEVTHGDQTNGEKLQVGRIFT
jgi:hypothetical protein